MRRYGRTTAIVAVLALALAGCGSDDGATVRDLGADGTATGSASASGSASGSAPGSASASGSVSASASASGTGSAPVTGSASGSEPAVESDGGYSYASDVSAHRLVVEDVCTINALLDEEPIDFESVATIYREGEHSVNADGSVRSIGGFASATDRAHGLEEYYGTPTPLDDFVTAALDGSGRFEGTSEAVRRQGVQKGVQNQVMVAWMVHELNSALAKAGDGEFDAAEGAPHNWDEAWAFYHGSQPDCAPYATADKRGEDFGTVTEDGTSAANSEILEAMNSGRDALLASDAAGAEEAAEAVRRAIFVTYSQAAIRYATIAAQDAAAGDDEAAATHQAEGYAFWRVIESAAAEAGADVEVVNSILQLGNEPGANGGGEEVRSALEPAWDQMGIGADDIGTLQ